MSDKCPLPRRGWNCTRKIGHPGPCAAMPTEDYVNGYLDALGWVAHEIEDQGKKLTIKSLTAAIDSMAEIMSK
jgi:hypothetical protein